MSLALVVLAAGLGTRFGGLKQLAPVGPRGEALLDLTISDAQGCGFGSVILVVRSEIEQAVVDHVGRFAPAGLSIRTVRQDALGPPRPTPWGTTHALLACRGVLDGPFAVANADDSYGASSLQTLAAHMVGSQIRAGRAALAGFRLGNTLSPSGAVTRAVCQVDEHGHLLDIVEHTGVRRAAGRVTSDLADGLTPDTTVSMNLWAFDHSVLDELRPRFEKFAALHADDRTEWRIPDAVAELVADHRLEVTVLPTDAAWHGITYADDVEWVREALTAGH